MPIIFPFWWITEYFTHTLAAHALRAICWTSKLYWLNCDIYLLRKQMTRIISQSGSDIYVPIILHQKTFRIWDRCIGNQDISLHFLSTWWPLTRKITHSNRIDIAVPIVLLANCIIILFNLPQPAWCSFLYITLFPYVQMYAHYCPVF